MLANLGTGKNEEAERVISGLEVFTNWNKTPVPSRKSELTIRLAGVDEAAQIVELMRVIFSGKEHFSRAGFASTSEVEQLMSQGKFLLAKKHKEIIGCVYIEPHIEASILDLLAVAPSQRRVGIGSQLLEAAERLISNRRCLFMHLRVMNFDWETIRFCRHRGYVEFGIESFKKDQPVSMYRHVVRMFKRLEADCLAF